MQYFILFLSFFLFSSTSIQTYELTGTVVDENNNAVIAATIQIKGTEKGTVTDAQGHFQLEVEGTDTLVISYVGMITEVIPVNNRKQIKIVLQTDQSVLEDVVITGYQVQERALFSGSKGSLPSPSRVISISYEQRETYNNIEENGFIPVTKQPLSTFSVDVDRASYSNVRRKINNGYLPEKDAVRIEELINYFSYQYDEPVANADHPLKVNTEISQAPWNKDNLLMKVGLKARSIDMDNAKPSNIVFLIDVSGSMNSPQKLPLLKSSFKLLLNSLSEDDRVAIVVYASQSEIVLESTPATEKETIINALESLQAGGSTAGGEGIQLAYKTANDHFIEGGNNRILLATDGDFNVGIDTDDDLQRLVEKERESGIYISVLGFGMGNYRDDMAETIADKGNGNYAYIDNIIEAKKVLVNEFGGTFYTIAKDVKLQLEFNPKYVKEYRLIGYENRLLDEEDFTDDKKDAGEIGSGHTVTAMYEIVPSKGDLESTLRYQKQELNETALESEEIGFLKIRYKEPVEESNSILFSYKIPFTFTDIKDASKDFRFASSVASFGMLLRDSEHKGKANWVMTKQLAETSVGEDEEGYRTEFVRLVEAADLLQRNE